MKYVGITLDQPNYNESNFSIQYFFQNHQLYDL